MKKHHHPSQNISMEPIDSTTNQTYTSSKIRLIRRKRGGKTINRLKELRQAKGITQSGMAQKIGVSFRQYQRYEADILTPPVKIAKRISEEFDQSIETIFLS